jgi:hypothetical protein
MGRFSRDRRRASTKAALAERAKKAGIGGYSHMTKAELARALTPA